MTLTSFPRASAERVLRYRADGLWDGRGLADGLEAAAARRPGALALMDNDRGLTYAELAGSVAAALAALRAAGVRAGAGAVLVTGNTRNGVIAYHALLRAGVTCVVLDRRRGAADLTLALDALPAGSHVIVGAAELERLGEALPAAGLLPLELFCEQPAPPVRVPVVDRSTTWHEPDRDRAAVVMFTSGTTSRPKAVVHSLNTLTAGAGNMARITSADESTVAYLVSPLTSIAGLMQVHLAADQHAALVLEDRFEPARTLQRMTTAGATLLGGAPVIAERLLRAADAGAGIGLRTLALGGAMLPRPLLELATDSFGIAIARVYGSSEAPNFSGSVASDDRERRLSDDGALMPGSEVRIGSTNDRQEGMLRGPSLFLGYADPADDSASFEDGWYRSGDQIEVERGRLSVVGRLKEVVNRNGLKISLNEIDAVLAGLPGTLEYASFAVPDASTGERLAVAVRPVDGAGVTLDDVVDYLLAQGTARRKLPEQLVRWDGPLPRTPSGKVIRSRLAMEAPAMVSEAAGRLRGN